MRTLFDVLNYCTTAIVVYYVVMFIVGRQTLQRREDDEAFGPRPVFVLVVPAHNEGLVIAETVRRLRVLDNDRFVGLIVNDGSTDETGARARAAAASDPRIVVVDREPEVAGKGKGDVLNHAYELITDMVRNRDPRLLGATSPQVVVGVIDADGWLEPHALTEVARYYGDPQVAGVQVPVRIWNARDGFFPFMQEIEFFAFSMLVQGGRDVIGSIGLGGNGQFVRLSALQTLGPRPWSKCLTEDLDLALSLVEQGWRNRFCPHAAVSQQGLSRLRPFLRQRTRWIQGHYQCWHHFRAIWRTPSLPLATKLDLSVYLGLVASITLCGLQVLLVLGQFFGLYTVPTSYLSFIHNDLLYRGAVLAVTSVPILTLAVAYQRSAPVRLQWWAAPGMFFLFSLYTYMWGAVGTTRALVRMALRRDSWVKTPRMVVSSESLVSEENLLAARTT